MILFLILAIIVGASVVMIEEALRKAPEGVEDEHGFHVIGESAKKTQGGQEHADEGGQTAIHASFLGAIHSK
jgi:hypothetical protein